MLRYVLRYVLGLFGLKRLELRLQIFLQFNGLFGIGTGSMFGRVIQTEQHRVLKRGG